MLVYAATIFLSAFLLFQVQPLIAKFILPWFGGSAAVWSAALLFFQLVLLAGYFYAHCLNRYFKPKTQFIVHATFLAASLAVLPIIPSAGWKPSGADDPTFRILLLLAATIGLPYTLLSATSPLLQAWFVRTHAGAIPYRLFALSNLGSMIALLSYPTLIEPRWTLGAQARIWSLAYVVFAAACSATAWKSRSGRALMDDPAAVDVPSPSAGTIALWIGLAACASTLLLAVTTHLTQNIAPIPLLWIAPLSLYLLSFILCFESDRIYNRWVFLPLLAGSLGLFVYSMYMYENNFDIKRLVEAMCGALFVCCMVCHGELARSRPNPRYLTLFYLMVSVGGAIGGIFVALIAPRVFRSYLELPVAMAACAALVTCVLWRKKSGALNPLWLRVAMVVATVVFAGYLWRAEIQKSRDYILSVRNFYGVLHVRDDASDGFVPAQRVLIHGTIDHGTQLTGPNTARVPTSYFGRTSGIARALRALHSSGPIRMGVLGLGAGVTAALAQPGDTLHYYEINPLIVQIAKTQFGFYEACPADKQLFMGDGRLVLESLPDEKLDFLAMDAFSSDAVPMHLLTREAYVSYQRHLKPTGVLAVNISNRYLDLAPVIAQPMAEMGWQGMVVDDDGTEEPFYDGSTWVLLTRAPEIFGNASFTSSGAKRLVAKPGFHAWTDDFSNMIQILK